jgi:type II secretory pathway component GspD/PulD (secretin)
MQQSILLSPGQNRFLLIHMKRIFLSLSLVGIMACSLAAFAQTNSPAADAAPASATPAQDTAQPAAPADKAPAAETPAAPAVNEVVQAVSRPVQPGVVIPLIVMDDVPLTDAIRNLARQAGINYMIDPKVGFGQVAPDGKPGAQPNVSIRWENITAEQALAALLNNYTLEMVEDPKSKIARVTTKNPAALPPLLTKIFQLKYASPSNILTSVQGTIDPKRSKVIAETRTSQLVVVATEKEMAAVEELIQSLDTQTKQVLIEARILETTVNPTTTKGVDWSGTLAAQHVVAGNNALPGVAPTKASTGTNGVIIPGTAGTIGGILSAPQLLMQANGGSFFNPAQAFLNADGVKAVISFLNTYSEVREISTPRTVTTDNEKAIVEVGELYPIVNVSAGTANTTGGSQVTYSNLTIRLDVTPRISANDYVNLTVIPSIVKLGSPVVSQVAGQSSMVNSFLTRTMSTHVMIPSGNTLVMGGLIQDQINSGNTKVPILGDIPVIGYLFRSDSKNRTKTDLVLFITPTIVQDEDYQPTKSDYLKTPAPKKDLLEAEWSAWDSGKPMDWSKRNAKPYYEDPITTAK